MTPDDDVAVPTACTLDANQARERAARWAKLAATSQVDARTERGLLEVAYADTDETAAEVAALAALERECCGFLDYRVTRDGRHITLTVLPAPGASPDVADDLATLAAVVTR